MVGDSRVVTAKTELAAVLTAFKKWGVRQLTVAELFSFDHRGRSIKLDKTTLSSIKSKPYDPKYASLLTALLTEFDLEVIKTSEGQDEETLNYMVNFSDDLEVEKKFKKLFLLDAPNRTPILTRREEGEEKLRLFEGITYEFYDRVPEGIERHVLQLGENKRMTIHHADGIQVFNGKYRLDHSRQFLKIDMQLGASRDKEVAVQVAIGQGSVPQLCLGIYLGTGKNGGKCEACTFVLARYDHEEKPEPRQFYGQRIHSSHIPEQIRYYLLDERRNRLSVPARINNPEVFKAWRRKSALKSDGGLLDRLEPYLKSYRMFYVVNHRLRHYQVLLDRDDFRVRARVFRYDDDTDRPVFFSKGTVSDKGRFVVIELGDPHRHSFIQFEIGGYETDRHECYCGLVTGLDAHHQHMVAYPIVLVSESVYVRSMIIANNHVNDYLEWINNQPNLRARSPDAFLLENLPK